MSRPDVGIMGECPHCKWDLGDNPRCDNCQKLWNDANTCPCCGEPLLADQEWQLRNDRTAGEPAEGGDYVHAWCDDRLNTEAESADSDNILVAENGGDSDA